jgi:hypothetical protein
MSEFSEIIKKVLIPMFYKEAQLGRSIRQNNIDFKRKLFSACIELSKKADNQTLINNQIREKIKAISDETKVSIGQAQKVVNVYLKYYCLLTEKSLAIIKELDCPLDSQIMSKFKTKNLRKISLKNLIDFNEYIAWQNHLENIGNGMRLGPDIETYDKERIKLFLS